MGRKRMTGMLSLNHGTARVEGGKIVEVVRTGPPIPLDIVDIERDTDEKKLTITSRTTGASVTCGYTPELAAGWERVFGSRPNS